MYTKNRCETCLYSEANGMACERTEGLPVNDCWKPSAWVVEYDRLLAIVTAAHDDYCPYIHSCNGEQPDEYEHPDVENCPCAEWGAPCWYYKNVYLPFEKLLRGKKP